MDGKQNRGFWSRPRLRLAAGLLTLNAIAGSGRAQTPPPSPGAVATTGLACTQKLGAPALALWTTLGAGDGRLGCPTGPETPAAASSHGVTSLEVPFGDAGAIFTHTSGPLAGEAFAIAFCFPLYFQYGGPAGWLGLPVTNPEETPDGETQVFEGGVMRHGRALDSCEAERGD